MKLECNCDDWQKSMPQIETAQLLAADHRIFYTGVIFKFCPWCGKEFIKHDDEKNG